MTKCFLAIVVACCCRLTGEAAQLAVDFTWASGTDGGSEPTTVGWTFKVNTSVAVSALGLWDEHAFTPIANNHHVGIWKEDGTLVTDITVGPQSFLLRSAQGTSFRYEMIRPVVLLAGESYRIGAVYGIGQLHDFYATVVNTGPFVQPSITYGEAASSASGAGFAFPGTLPGSAGFFGPNFFLQPVPEPSTVALIGLGVIGLMLAMRGKWNERVRLQARCS